MNQGTELHNIPIAMVMTPLTKIVTVEPAAPAAAAARILIDNEVDCLPVVQHVKGNERQMKLIGRITKTNFTRLLVDLAEGKGR